MSLLEKATRGSGTSGASARTSLFSRALAAHAAIQQMPAPTQEAEPVFEPERDEGPEFRFDGLVELQGRLDALPPYYDSVFEAWSLVSEAMPLSALSLFLPQGDFLVPAALRGFPSRTTDEIPKSNAQTSRIGIETLGVETLGGAAQAILAPILGIPQTLSLRASAMRHESDFVGLWVFHDRSLDASSTETRARVGSLLARIGEVLPPFPLAVPAIDPAATLLDASRKYPWATALAFDLSSFFAGAGPRLRGLEASAIRSAFLASCLRILSRGGAAVAYGDLSAACILGSTSPIDSGLALFQFTKTLRRILPFLSAIGFPEGRALGFDPSSDAAHGDLGSFLSP